MAYPIYVTNVDFLLNGMPIPCAVITTSADFERVVPFDSLDLRGQSDLDKLVVANGGVLPLVSLSVAENLLLDNGSTWWETYKGAIRTYDPTPTDNAIITKGNDTISIYYDGTDWRYDYNDTIVSPTLGSGDATAANQATQIALETAIRDRLPPSLFDGRLGINIKGFDHIGTVTLAYTNVTDRVALPATGTVLKIQNDTNFPVFVMRGNSSVNALITDYRIPAHTEATLNRNTSTHTHLAVISGDITHTGTVYISTGEGW